MAKTGVKRDNVYKQFVTLEQCDKEHTRLRDVFPEDYIPRMHALIAREGQIKAQATRKHGGGRACFLCGDHGHFARDCPVSKNVNDDEFSAYRDAVTIDSAGPAVNSGDDSDEEIDEAKVASLVHHLSAESKTPSVGGVDSVPDAENEELRLRLEGLKGSAMDKPPIPSSSPPSRSDVAPPPPAVVPVSVRDLKKKHGVHLRRVRFADKVRDDASLAAVGTDLVPPPLPVIHAPLKRMIPPVMGVPSAPPMPAPKVAAASNPLRDAVESVTRECDDEVEPSLRAEHPIKIQARKIVTVARRVTKTDLPDEIDMAAQATMIDVAPFKDVEPLGQVRLWAIVMCLINIIVLFFVHELVENDCEFWRPAVCRPYSISGWAVGELTGAYKWCGIVSFAPLNVGIFNEQISNMRPFAWATGSTYTQWQECQRDHILPLEIRWALKNSGVRSIIMYIVMIMWLYWCRRTTWYTPLEYTNLESKYDVRNLANMARPVVFANPMYRRFRVTEISGNMWVDFVQLITFQATRDVVVSMELFASLQSCRQQLLSMKGKKSSDLITGLGRNAELQDQLNIDRYVDALHGVHLQTVYLAYHHLMWEERHKEAVF